MKLPIAFASVCLTNQSGTLIRKVGTTNDKGFFEIEDILKGSYSLQIQSVGFAAYSEIIAIENDISNKATFLSCSYSHFPLSVRIIKNTYIKSK